MAVPILDSRKHWECPNCSAVDVTMEAQPHTRYHSCPGLYGFSAPMVPKGTSAAVNLVVREDYVGSEQGILYADNKPIMAVKTERADGSNDVAVFAPYAVGSDSRLT